MAVGEFLIIPYYQDGSSWQGNELKYALRSWHKHFWTPVMPVIVGDLPEWSKGVMHIPHKRDPEAYRTNFFDTLSKLKLALDTLELPEHIIYTYDDVYLLKNSTVFDIDRPYCKGLYAKGNCTSCTGKHHDDQLKKTMKFFHTPYNYETHLPRSFNVKKLKDLFDKYPVMKKRLLISSLYYNEYGSVQDNVMLSKNDDIKIAFVGRENESSWSSDDGMWILQETKKKRFLNHNDAGLTTKLKKFLMLTFDEKSPFEK